MRVHLSFVQTRHKAVTTTWHRLNEGRVFGGIAQGSAELADRDIDCMVEVSKTFLRPDTGLKFLASDQLTPVLQQDLQHSEGLILEFDAAPRLTDLSGMEIGLKFPNTNCAVSVMHGGFPFFASLPSLVACPVDAAAANRFADFLKQHISSCLRHVSGGDIHCRCKS